MRQRNCDTHTYVTSWKLFSYAFVLASFSDTIDTTIVLLFVPGGEFHEVLRKSYQYTETFILSTRIRGIRVII